MPKISSNNTVRIHTDQADETLHFDIFYNKEHKFYIEFPKSMEAMFDSTNQEDRPFTKKSKIHDPNSKRIVTGSTEEEVTARFRKQAAKFMSASMKERQVILVFYDNKNGSGQYSSHDFRPAGLVLSLCYCTEISIDGGKTKYYKYEERTWTGSPEIVKTEVHVGYHEKFVAIDDTPESRAFLESIHANIKRLTEAMDMHTGNAEALLSLIKSNQKLLG